MEELAQNLTMDDVLDLIKDFPIIPLRNKIVITTNVEDFEEDDINLGGTEFSPEQYVLAVGSYTKDLIQPGDKVYLDLERMSVLVNNDEDVEQPLRKIVMRPIQIGDRVFGMITDDKIDYIIKP